MDEGYWEDNYAFGLATWGNWKAREFRFLSGFLLMLIAAANERIEWLIFGLRLRNSDLVWLYRMWMVFDYTSMHGI